MSLAEDEVKTVPYGSWRSPLSSKVVSGSSISFQDLRVDPKNPGRYNPSLYYRASDHEWPREGGLSPPLFANFAFKGVLIILCCSNFNYLP